MSNSGSIPKDLDSFLGRKWLENLRRLGSSALGDVGFVVATANPEAPNARVLTGSSDITVTDGGAGGNITLDLSNTGTAGTYTKVTTDAKGRVTVGAAATTSDIPEGSNLYFTTARALTALGSAFTAGAVLFGNGTNTSIDAANFFYNDTDNRLSLGLATDYTAKLNILVGSATEKALAIRLNGSQTANAIEIQNSAGTVLSGFRHEGSLLIQNATSTTIGPAGYYCLFAKADGAAASCAFVVDRNRSQTNSGQGVGFWLKDSTSYVGMRMWANTFVQNLYDFEFFSQLGLTMTMPYSGGIYIYNPLVNTPDISCMKVPAQTIYAGGGAADPGGFFVFDAVTIAATSPNTLADTAALLLKGAPVAGVNMTLTRRYNLLAIANAAGDVLAAYRAHASQTGNLTEWQSSTPTNLALINKDGGFVFNEQGRDTDCRIEGDTDANLIYTDASTDRVGIGTSSPVSKLDVNGTVTVTQLDILAQGDLRLQDTTGGEYVALQAAGAVTTYTLTLPAAVGSTGQYLAATDNAGTLGWTTPAAAKVTPLFDYYSDVGNSGTSETDLYSSTLAAGELANNGDKLVIWYGINLPSASGATVNIRMYFGGSAIFGTGALTKLGAGWMDIRVEIIRVSSTAIRYTAFFQNTGYGSVPLVGGAELAGLTLSSTNVIKITGQAGAGGASNDIVAKCGSIRKIVAV